MNPCSSTFAIRLDSLGDFVSVVIVPWSIGQVGHVQDMVVDMVLTGHPMFILWILRVLLVWEIGRICYANILFLYPFTRLTVRLSLPSRHLGMQLQSLSHWNGQAPMAGSMLASMRLSAVVNTA